MQEYFGTYPCKVDAKGRVRIPSKLLQQIEEAEREEFILNRDFEKCIALYTKTEWEKVTTKINSLDNFIRKNRDFQRYFYKGVNKVSPDSSDRILMDKLLIEYANIQKEVVIYAYSNKIEIWAADEYKKMMSGEPDDLGNLAQDVVSNSNG